MDLVGTWLCRDLFLKLINVKTLGWLSVSGDGILMWPWLRTMKRLQIRVFGEMAKGYTLPWCQASFGHVLSQPLAGKWVWACSSFLYYANRVKTGRCSRYGYILVWTTTPFTIQPRGLTVGQILIMWVQPAGESSKFSNLTSGYWIVFLKFGWADVQGGCLWSEVDHIVWSTHGIRL